MNNPSTSLPIVVGIDGSKYAVRAALWAAAEAVERDVPIVLTCVIKADEEYRGDEYVNAELALHEAWIAVESTGYPVKLESKVLQGDPADQLVDASRNAQMVCVGSRGTDDSRHHQHGSTAAALAQNACSPIAIVRRRETCEPIPEGRWIVAALDESSSASTVLQTAIAEAELRDAPVLALTRRVHETRGNVQKDYEAFRASLTKYLDELKRDNTELEICSLPISEHISNVLEQSATIDQLVIVDSADPSIVGEVVGPEARAVLRHTNCSVLVLRSQRAVASSNDPHADDKEVAAR